MAYKSVVVIIDDFTERVLDVSDYQNVHLYDYFYTETIEVHDYMYGGPYGTYDGYGTYNEPSLGGTWTSDIDWSTNYDGNIEFFAEVTFDDKTNWNYFNNANDINYSDSPNLNLVNYFSPVHHGVQAISANFSGIE